MPSSSVLLILLRQSCSGVPARVLVKGQMVSLNVAWLFIDCYNTKNEVGIGRSPAISDTVDTPVPLPQQGAYIACYALLNPQEVLPHCLFAVERSPSIGDKQCFGKLEIVEGIQKVKDLSACGDREHETGFKFVRVKDGGFERGLYTFQFNFFVLSPMLHFLQAAFYLTESSPVGDR